MISLSFQRNSDFFLAQENAFQLGANYARILAKFSFEHILMHIFAPKLGADHSHEVYSTPLWLLHGGPKINPQIDWVEAVSKDSEHLLYFSAMPALLRQPVQQPKTQSAYCACFIMKHYILWCRLVGKSVYVLPPMLLLSLSTKELLHEGNFSKLKASHTEKIRNFSFN